MSSVYTFSTQNDCQGYIKVPLHLIIVLFSIYLTYMFIKIHVFFNTKKMIQSLCGSPSDKGRLNVLNE